MVRVLLAAASLLLGCRASAFACEQDDDCDASRSGGVCEPSGFCSFPDPACPAGRRYGELAGDGLAGSCVEPDGATGSESTGTTITTTTTTTPSSTTILDGSGELDTHEVSATSVTVADDTTTDDGACPPGWWDCAWRQRIELVPQADGVALASVPLLVVLTPDRVAFGDATAMLPSFRFVDEAGTVLPHEIEMADETGIFAWVELPLLGASSGRFQLYWDNPAAADVEDAASVWQNGYAAVWHLQDGFDSLSGSELDASEVLPIAGAIAGAQLFDGDRSYMQADDQDDLFTMLAADGLTVEAFVRPDGFGDGQRGRIVDTAMDQYAHEGWSLGVRNDPGVPSALVWMMGRNNGAETLYAANAIVLGEWHYVVATHASDELALYLDGVPQNVLIFQPGNGAPDLSGNDPLTIGRIAGEDRRGFDGVIDEVRISAVVRSAEWVAVQNAAVRDQLLTYGTAEALP